MDTDGSEDSPAQPELQFEHAEFCDPGKRLGCAVCKQPISSTYYQIGAASFCPGCRENAEKSLGRKPGVRGFLRAAFYGTLAAAAGSVLFFAIAKLTGYNFGLIAIVIGVFVGQAVRRGSGGRGGLIYQLLAVFLTYGSIVSTHIPYIVEEIVKTVNDRHQTQAASHAATPAGVKTAGETPAPASDATEESPARKVASVCLAFGFVFGLACAVPFLSLSSGNGFMGLIIIAIGLMEAWKANRWVEVTFNGPFELKLESAEPAAPIA